MPDTSTENEIDTDEMTYECKYAIGTMFHDPIGGVWKYVKIVFGIYPEGEACFHQWVPWNGLAHLEETKKPETESLETSDAEGVLAQS